MYHKYSQGTSFLAGLPQPLFEYLVMVGSTGVVARPDDKAFPETLFSDFKNDVKVAEYNCKTITFNQLAALSVLYPLRTGSLDECEYHYTKICVLHLLTV